MVSVCDSDTNIEGIFVVMTLESGEGEPGNASLIPNTICYPPKTCNKNVDDLTHL